MKFFRMDSDLADWDAWDDILDSLERPDDFHRAFTLYMVLYSKMAKQYKNGVQTFTINRKGLAKSARISVKKCDYLTGRLQKFLYFTTEISGNFYKISYPNFLKKQKLPLRDGDGKFSPHGGESKSKSKNKSYNTSGTDFSDIPPPSPDCPPDDPGPPPMAGTEPAQTDPEPNPSTGSVPVASKINSEGLNGDKPPEASDFDRNVSESIYGVVKAMHEKFAHAPEIEAAKVDDWPVHIKRLRLKDGHSEKEIQAVLSFAFRDPFWKHQVQSTRGFRRMYPEIKKQAQIGRGKF